MFATLLFIFIYLCTIASRGLLLYDDNAIYSPALRVARGQILYKEVYTQYGPIMVWIQAAFIKIFGERLWSVRLATIFFYMLCFIMFYLVYKRVLPKKVVLVSEIVLVLLEPTGYGAFHSWSSIYALFFQLLLFWLFIKYIDTKKYRYLFLVGITAGCIFFSRQSCGLVFIFVSCMLVCIVCSGEGKKHLWRGSICFLTGIFVVFCTFYLYFCYHNCMDKWFNYAIVEQFNLLDHFVQKSDVIEQGVTSNIAQETIIVSNKKESSALKKILLKILMIIKCLFPYQLFGLFFFLPIVLVIQFFILSYRFLKKKTKQDKILWGICVLCIASWHQYFPLEGDLLHTYWAAFPMMGLFVYSIRAALKYFIKNKAIDLICILLVGGLCFPTVLNRVGKVTEMIRNHQYLAIEQCEWAKGIWLTKDESSFLDEYYKYIEKQEEKYGELIILNYTSCWLPESCLESQKELIANNDATKKVIFVRKVSEFDNEEQMLVCLDSFPMKCEYFFSVGDISDLK